MDQSRPDDGTVRAAIALAMRAPSIHSSQPWHWRLGYNSLHLFVDPTAYAAGDPNGRDLLISCGSTLHHLRIAFAAEGWATMVHRVPNASDASHLASVEFYPRIATNDDIALAAAISRRRMDRRRFSSWRVPLPLLNLLAERSELQGAMLRPALDPEVRFHLITAIAAAPTGRDSNAEVGGERTVLSGMRFGPTPMPSGAMPSAAPTVTLGYRETVSMLDQETMLAPNPQAELEAEEADAAELLVVSTYADDRISRLRAGEAMSAVLLTATDLHLASCPIGGLLSSDATVHMIREQVLGGDGYPQLVIRVGWAPNEYDPVPPSPRRAVDDFFDGYAN